MDPAMTDAQAVQWVKDNHTRIDRDLAAASKAKSWLLAKALPWLLSKWPHAATALATALAMLGINYVSSPSKVTNDPVIQEKKEEPKSPAPETKKNEAEKEVLSLPKKI